MMFGQGHSSTSDRPGASYCRHLATNLLIFRNRKAVGTQVLGRSSSPSAVKLRILLASQLHALAYSPSSLGLQTPLASNSVQNRFRAVKAPSSAGCGPVPVLLHYMVLLGYLRDPVLDSHPSSILLVTSLHHHKTAVATGYPERSCTSDHSKQRLLETALSVLTSWDQELVCVSSFLLNMPILTKPLLGLAPC